MDINFSIWIIILVKTTKAVSRGAVKVILFFLFLQVFRRKRRIWWTRLDNSIYPFNLKPKPRREGQSRQKRTLAKLQCYCRVRPVSNAEFCYVLICLITAGLRGGGGTIPQKNYSNNKHYSQNHCFINITLPS